MLRVVGCCFAISLTAVSPAAFALSATIGEPILPQSAKPGVANSDLGRTGPQGARRGRIFRHRNRRDVCPWLQYPA